jgi:hypothetical protein
MPAKPPKPATLAVTVAVTVAATVMLAAAAMALDDISHVGPTRDRASRSRSNRADAGAGMAGID